MKLPWSLAFVTITFALGADVQNTTLEEALSIIQSMPSCGSTCLLSGIANSTCEVADISCSCNNPEITKMVQACVLGACEIKEQLTTKNRTETLCQRPSRDQRASGQRSVIVGLTFSCLAYALRILSKVHSPCTSNQGWSHTLWWDDAVMAVALGCAIATSYSVIPLNANGLGTDVWTVPFDNITTMLRIYYWAEDAYLAALPAVKISLLLTYLRFFPSRRFRQACYVVIGLNVAYIIAFVLISVFQCIPIHLAWERWVYKDAAQMPGHCHDINAQGWASAAANVILDVCTLSLPLPVLWQLQLNKRKKFWLMLMFCVGFFVTIVSIVRLQMLVRFGNSHNLTWDYTALGYWSTVELHTSIVCASMPSIRNLLRKFMPYIMGSSTDGTGRSGPPKATSTGATNRTSRSVGLGIGTWDKEITIRTMHSDEEDFIPLEDATTNSHNKTAPLPPM
ncbi:hypothetical protein DOTSEDRAFT_74416 [Dothistroma septosporum NZE10]|uniref:CFEM domain-containing protein n=1 Tax=Dothistroma septosporum (strain NZE10 / CBS 128990) TaxID=675120 RepID=N1PEQ7_DOTSN|nr:hypothetical protein DOTSEDRAFT_74416 [Dothistroma septosporum NZE10]